VKGCEYYLNVREGGEGLCFNMNTLLWQSWCWMGKNGVEGEVLLLCCWGTIMSLKN